MSEKVLRVLREWEEEDDDEEEWEEQRIKMEKRFSRETKGKKEPVLEEIEKESNVACLTGNHRLTTMYAHVSVILLGVVG
ncbi:hypothetical protein FRX31_021950 [Thalictrum thalictroides]|uniref:Uncharacterized protein n=1 Tax=Thalictrum thalictroides TaxID=46969 RepID=A0A7J6VUD4_THATH|nr:hypothetical protein FRX31_021950 [Thalictrum thalictroides]